MHRVTHVCFVATGGARAPGAPRRGLLRRGRCAAAGAVRAARRCNLHPGRRRSASPPRRPAAVESCTTRVGAVQLLHAVPDVAKATPGTCKTTSRVLRLLVQDAITRAEEQLRIFFESVRRRARRQTLGPHAGNDLERAEGIRNRAPPSRDSRPPLL